MVSEKLTGWQPIETAPEHEPILVWVPEENRGWDSAEVVIIYRTETGMSFWTNGGSNGGSDVYFRKEPTHWQPLPAPPGTTRAPADLRSALEAAQKDRDIAQSAVEAWAGVCESLEAHLQDRVAMQDEANPAVYLSILRSGMANVQRDSRQIRASRWADYARQEAKIAALEAETNERCAKVCEQLAAGCRAELKDPANDARTISVLDGCISACTTLAANIAALAAAPTIPATEEIDHG